MSSLPKSPKVDKKSLELQLFDLLDINPHLRFGTAKDKLGISETHFYRVKGEWNKKHGIKKRKKKGSSPTSQPHMIKMKAQKPVRPLPSRDPGFFKFARWFSIPAYRGLFDWQEEHERVTSNAQLEMTLVPRDHGKSVKYTAKYEYSMHYQDYDVLLLGWTDKRKDIARDVYTFFEIHGLIEYAPSPYHIKLKNGSRFDCYLITSKETLGMHSKGEQNRFTDLTPEEWKEFKSLFKIDIDEDAERVFDEAELKAYVESRKGTTRKLWISIDDPIDISFRKERHKEETLELHFRSSLYPIHPDKWSFTGTHKFEGDIFDFWNNTFGKKLVKYIRGTRRSNGTLLCPEKFTARDQPTYKIDKLPYMVEEKKGKRGKLIPKLDKDGNKILKTPKIDLDEIREDVGEEIWWSEYEQQPHAIRGEVWDHIEYELMLDTPVNRKYDLCIISIDRATSSREKAIQNKKKASYTGCPILLREMKTGNRIIIEDYTDYINFDDLLIELNAFVIEFKAKHEQMLIIIIVEQQGGGEDFVTMAKNMRYFYIAEGKQVENKLAEIATIILLHNTGEKIPRIKERLLSPIKNGKTRLLKSKRGCEVETEILDFPHAAKLDAIDALANAEFYILEEQQLIYGAEGKRIKQTTDLYIRAAEGTLQKEIPELVNLDTEYNDLEAVDFNPTGRRGAPSKRRNIFDEF